MPQRFFRPLSILPALALAGCATGPSLQSRMAAYIGTDEAGLVQALGVPDKEITVNGVQFLAYTVRQRTQIVQPAGFAYLGGPFYGPVFPPVITNWSCQATFTVKDGKVFNVVLKGNDCG